MQQIIRVKIFLLLFSGAACLVHARSAVLAKRIHAVIDHKNATVGIAVAGYDGGDTLTLNGNEKFPLHSVFKYHIAIIVLRETDRGHLDLNQEIEIKKSDLANDTYSPIRDRYPGGITLKLSEVLRYTVSESDNIGCDLLLKLIGGPEAVEKYMHGKGINNIAIRYNEAVQESKWEYQYENWISPEAATRSLKLFFDNKEPLLSAKSHKLLWQLMKATRTGANRIRKNLPPGTVVAHKTGSSGKNDSGITGACNDIGIIFLPYGKYFYLSVFVSNSKESEDDNEKIIADVAKVVWDYFSEQYR